jgi:hypothetical protein
MSVARLSNEVVPEWIMSGKAVFTIKSLKTGTRFTYKVNQCDDKKTLFFVSLLTGSDNYHNYSYLGTINTYPASDPSEITFSTFRHGAKSRITPNALGAKTFSWFYDKAAKNALRNEPLEVWHEGKCGRCGKRLTDPESIASGIGPVCRNLL